MKQIDIGSFADIRLIGSPRFSEDERFAAFVLKKTSLRENVYLSDLYLLDRGSMSIFPLTFSGKVLDFCWSGRDTLLFSSAAGGPYAELLKNDREFSVYYELSLAGGEPREAFCIPLPVREIRPIGGGRFLLKTFCRMDRMAFYRLSPQQRREQARAYQEDCCVVFEDYPYFGDGQGDISARRTGLWLYDRSDGSLRPLTPPEFSVSQYDYRNGTLLYSGTAYRSEAKPLCEGVYVQELETGRVRCVVEPGSCLTGPLALLDDRIFLMKRDFRRKWEQNYPDMYFADPETLRLSLVGPYEYTAGRSTIAGDSHFVDNRLLCSDGRRVYFCSTVDEEACIRSLDGDGVLRDEIHSRGSCEGFDVRKGQILWCGQRDGGLQELYLGEQRVTELNTGFLSTHSVVRPVPLHCAAPDGTELRGWVMRPASYEPGKKFPVILHIHGGPCTAFSDVYFHEMQVWANRGYFVVFCNPRGSDGRGEVFADIRGKYGQTDYEDLMCFLDHALAEYPDADPGRVGVIGGSYGGFMTNWIIGHTDRFACAVSLRSVSNWVTLELLSDMGQRFVSNELKSSTLTDPKELWSRSPLKYAAHVKTPTLFIHSDHDFRCHMVESVAMYSALIQQGVETQLCIIQGESHGLSRNGHPSLRVTRMEKILAWLDAHLLTGRPSAEA